MCSSLRTGLTQKVTTPAADSIALFCCRRWPGVIEGSRSPRLHRPTHCGTWRPALGNAALRKREVSRLAVLFSGCLCNQDATGLLGGTCSAVRGGALCPLCLFRRRGVQRVHSASPCMQKWQPSAFLVGNLCHEADKCQGNLCGGFAARPSAFISTFHLGGERNSAMAFLMSLIRGIYCLYQLTQS